MSAPAFTYQGTGSLPLVPLMVAALSAAIAPLVFDLQAQLAALLAVTVTVRFGLDLSFLFGLSLALAGPSIAFDFSAALIAKLTLQLGLLNALFDLLGQLKLLLPNAGVHVVAYTGATASMGPTIGNGAAIAGPGGFPVEGTEVVALFLMVDLATDPTGVANLKAAIG